MPPNAPPLAAAYWKPGYTFLDQGGHTYIEGGISAAPEPASAALIGLGNPLSTKST